MTPAWNQGGRWPNALQELVLRAALLDREAALPAWDEFCAAGGLDKLDQGSFRMLPLVYRNLSRQGALHPTLGVLLGIHRQAWCETRLKFRRAVPLVGSLRSAGIPVLLLKGAALALLYYRDPGLRPMDDLDLLVPEDRALDAMAMLEARGFRRLVSHPRLFTRDHLRYRHSLGFRHTEMGEVDLHWHVTYQALSPDVDEPFWQAAVPLDFEGVQVVALSPTDQLLHAIAHGTDWNFVPPMRWIADAWEVLQATPEIDWDRLLAQSERHRVTLRLRDGLRYLADRLGAPVPAPVLAALDRHRPSRAERLAYERGLDPDKLQGPLDTLAAVWFYYTSGMRDRDTLARVAGFPSYLQYYWGIEDSRLSLAGAALRWVQKRIKLAFS